MTPKDYKGKTVFHVPTNTSFVVIGGQKRRSGKCFLKDESGNLYPMEECQIVELNQLEFDVRKIKAAPNLNALLKFQQAIGNERFEKAWTEIEKDPIEAALVSILYCDNSHDKNSSEWKSFNQACNEYGYQPTFNSWNSFEAMCEAYQVSKNYPENNKVFRSRLRQNEALSQMVAIWYQNREAA